MNEKINNEEKIDLSHILENSDIEPQNKLPENNQSFYSGTPKIIQWVIKYSRGSMDEKQASYLIWGFVVLAFIVSFFLFFGTSWLPNKKAATVTPLEIDGGPVLGL
jgi:hypothetical protein